MRYRWSLISNQSRRMLLWLHQMVEDGAHLAITVNELWGVNCERTYLDANPYAPSNHSTNPKRIYRKHESAKKRSYEARICEVEHGSFTLLILFATGLLEEWPTLCYILPFDV